MNRAPQDAVLCVTHDPDDFPAVGFGLRDGHISARSFTSSLDQDLAERVLVREVLTNKGRIDEYRHRRANRGRQITRWRLGEGRDNVFGNVLRRSRLGGLLEVSGREGSALKQGNAHGFEEIRARTEPIGLAGSLFPFNSEVAGPKAASQQRIGRVTN